MSLPICVFLFKPGCLMIKSNQTRIMNYSMPVQNGYYYPNYNTTMQNSYNYMTNYSTANQDSFISGKPNATGLKTNLNQSYVTKNRLEAEKLKLAGNKYLSQKNYNEAIKSYQQSLIWDPTYTDSIFNMAKVYKTTGDYDAAIACFNNLLTIDPKDFEARTFLGELYENTGSIDKAMQEYRIILNYEPKYDFARRNLLNLYIKKLALSDPERAKNIKKEQSDQNLKSAMNLIYQNASPTIVNNLQGLEIVFGNTEEVNGYDNLAQYEHNNKRILINDKLSFADPGVIATYIVHEAVHAGDRDSITSIREEQDAFREMTKFWMNVNNGNIDPDLTLALTLYLENPQKLDAKVEEVYLRRDSTTRMTSPNHGEAAGWGSWVDMAYDKFRSLLPAGNINNYGLWLNSVPANYYNPANNYYYQQNISNNPFYNTSPYTNTYNCNYLSKSVR